tara:strand:- start:18 stop:3020 length:3003 start_codon:yes stop_codon:yes gene_type:complete
MAKTSVTLDLSEFGISGVGNVTLQDVEETVNGQGIEAFGTRSSQERDQIKQIIEQIQTSSASATSMPKNIQADLLAYEQRIQKIEDRINDPIGNYLGEVKEEAMAGPGFKAVGSNLLSILPGGNPFDLATTLEGAVNIAQKTLISDNPKAQIGDFGVIGSDVGAYFMLRKNPLAKMRIDNALLSNAVKNSPAKSASALLATNVFARGASNKAYDLLNSFARFVYDIPNPEEAAMKNNELRNLYEMRNELLWSGGAVGLSNVFPFIKSTWGKKLLGITEESAKKIKTAERAGIPMNVFSVSESGMVQGSGKVIGLFPFTATKARQVQNAQQVAISNKINNTLNNLSPIGLMNEAGLLADKSFREGVSSLAATKSLMYESTMAIANKIDAQFIPTDRIREQAAKLGFKQNKTARDIKIDYRAPGSDVAVSTSLRDIMSQVNSLDQAEKLKAILPQLANMKDTHISGAQFMELQEILNDMLRSADQMDMGEGFAQSIKNFTSEMTTTLNDFDNYKVLEDKGKEALKRVFMDSMNESNKFMMLNEDILKGRTAQILSLANPNITKAGAEEAFGFQTIDMMTDVLVDSKALQSPLAIKEMKKALGKQVIINADGTKETVDVFSALAKSVIDNRLRQATRYISGQLPTGGKLGGSAEQGFPFVNSGVEKKPFVSSVVGSLPFSGKVGSEASQSGNKMVTRTIDGEQVEVAKDFGMAQTTKFNIPILDVERMKDIFGITDPNKALGMQEILGKETWTEMRDVLELADSIQQTSFGDVSDFVKRRGFLGGANAVTNLITGGMIASNPFGNVGMMLMARYGMTTLADPEFLKGVSTLMNTEVGTLAKRNALIQLGRMRWDDIRGEKADQLPPELVQDFNPGNPMDVMQYLIFSDNQNAFPGSERMLIETDERGNAVGIDITKSESQPTFSEDGQRTGQELAFQEETENIEPSTTAPGTATDPFLNVDFENMQQINPAAGASGNINADQRVALASGNLDEAIALGNRGQV